MKRAGTDSKIEQVRTNCEALLFYAAQVFPIIFTFHMMFDLVFMHFFDMPPMRVNWVEHNVNMAFWVTLICLLFERFITWLRKA